MNLSVLLGGELAGVGIGAVKVLGAPTDDFAPSTKGTGVDIADADLDEGARFGLSSAIFIVAPAEGLAVQ